MATDRRSCPERLTTRCGVERKRSLVQRGLHSWPAVRRQERMARGEIRVVGRDVESPDVAFLEIGTRARIHLRLADRNEAAMLRAHQHRALLVLGAAEEAERLLDHGID